MVDENLILPATEQANQTDRDLASLLVQAPADVTERLEQIGDFALNADNLVAMRQRPIREPALTSDAVRHEDYLIPGAPGDPDIAVRVHQHRTDAGEPQPCVLSIHGGGYVIGTDLGDDARFDRWASELGCVGVVGYRLAPETPYPGPLEDCYAALGWCMTTTTPSSSVSTLTASELSEAAPAAG